LEKYGKKRKGKDESVGQGRKKEKEKKDQKKKSGKTKEGKRGKRGGGGWGGTNREGEGFRGRFRGLEERGYRGG